jgi:hypothetical protein
MFIYNITTKVDHQIINDWMKWQREIHIPEIMATGCFYDHRFYELLEHEEEDGRTFVIQFLAKTKSDYEKYIEEYASELRQKSFEKWNYQTVSFRTLLQNVQ